LFQPSGTDFSIGGVDLPFLAALRAFVQVEAVPDVLDPFPLVDMVAVFGPDVTVSLALRARGSEVAEEVPVLGSVFFPVEFVLVKSQVPSAVSLAQRAFDGGAHVFGRGGRSGEVDESVRVVGIEISFHCHVSLGCYFNHPGHCFQDRAKWNFPFPLSLYSGLSLSEKMNASSSDVTSWCMHFTKTPTAFSTIDFNSANLDSSKQYRISLNEFCWPSDIKCFSAFVKLFCVTTTAEEGSIFTTMLFGPRLNNST